MAYITSPSVLQKDKVGLQELTEAVPDFEQDGVSLYANSLLDKQNERVDNLDDSLCEDENAKEIDCLVPSKEDLTQLTNSENIADHLVNMEKNYNLVDELFDGRPTVSHNANSSDNTISLLNENFDKKIAPLFTSTKKNKRFRAPVQSIVVENTGGQPDDKNRIESCDTQIEKAKPVFKSGTKSSTGKKRKLSETSKGEDETISKPLVKRLKSDKSKKKSCEPANSNAEAKQTSFDIEEKAVMSSDDLVTKVSSTTSKEVSSTAEKVRKKKEQKKIIENENEETAIDGVKKLTPCEQPDRGKSTQSCDIKTGKAKPMFKPGTKSSIGKKRKLSETSKDGDENISDSPASGDGEAKEINFTIKEGTDVSSNDSVKEAEASSSSTSKQVLPTAERINKKRQQKKATDCKDKKAAGDGRKNKKETNASKKKAAQQQAKIDMSCKSLDREQRKAEKELQKISRELEKVRKQKSNKGKKPVEMNKPSSSSSSGQLWVQCDQPDCLKWRRLKHCENPSEIPEKWFCSMNPVSEEEYSDLSDSQEYVYATYAPGAIVWAKITGYPWWPAMVQYDTNKDAFYEKHPSCHTPIAYHVVFFGKPVSRAWVHSLCLQAFLPDEDPNTKVAQKYNNPLTMAVKQADEANQTSVEERLAKYSFDKLYTGKSMYIDDQWASDESSKETKKRKRGAPKKSQHKDNEL